MEPNQQTPKQTDNPPKQKIILDTNIFSDMSGSDVKGFPLTLYLLDLVERGFEFALSGITIYELMRGLSKENETKILAFLSPYFRYYVSDEVLIVSGQLDNLMKMENIVVNSIDHGDKIIASTAILTGSLILTANVRDFPWPFFHEVEYNPIQYKVGNKTKCHMVSLLRPDFDLIKRHFEERK